MRGAPEISEVPLKIRVTSGGFSKLSALIIFFDNILDAIDRIKQCAY